MPFFIVRVVTCIETCNVEGFEVEVTSTCDLYWCVLGGKALVK